MATKAQIAKLIRAARRDEGTRIRALMCLRETKIRHWSTDAGAIFERAKRAHLRAHRVLVGRARQAAQADP